MLPLPLAARRYPVDAGIVELARLSAEGYLSAAAWRIVRAGIADTEARAHEGKHRPPQPSRRTQPCCNNGFSSRPVGSSTLMPQQR